MIKAKSRGVRYNSDKFKERDTRYSFPLKLSSKFQSLFIKSEGRAECEGGDQMGKEGLEEQWRVITHV